MLFLPHYYQFVFFCDLSEFKPSANTIKPLLEEFEEFNLLPATYQEMGVTIDVTGDADNTVTPQPRLRFASPGSDWVVDFDTPRLSVEHRRNDPRPANAEDVSAFWQRAKVLTERFLNRFPRTANRLSLVTRGLVHNATEQEMSQVYTALTKAPQFYKDNPPHEWTTRACARCTEQFNSKEEQLNVISMIRRMKGSLVEKGKPKPFDSVEVVFDINTFQGARTPRFGAADLEGFVSIASSIRTTLLDEIGSFFQ